MPRFKLLCPCGFAMLVALCGCAATPPRVLTEIRVSPASAVGSSGDVQFVATGVFSGTPLTESPLAVNWSFSGFTSLPIPAGVAISPSGLAHCDTFKGSVPVFAVHAFDPNAALPAQVAPGTGVGFVSGSASLTCP